MPSPPSAAAGPTTAGMAGRLLLATDRTDGKDGRRLDHVVALDSVPAGLMTSKVPVLKLVASV